MELEMAFPQSQNWSYIFAGLPARIVIHTLSKRMVSLDNRVERASMLDLRGKSGKCAKVGLSRLRNIRRLSCDWLHEAPLKARARTGYGTLSSAQKYVRHFNDN